MFVVGTLGSWLIGLLAEAGRKRLTTFVLGGEQERALRSVATKAVQLTANELRPGDDERADELAMVINQVFGGPAPDALAGHAMVLEALQAGEGSAAGPGRYREPGRTGDPVPGRGA